MATIPIKYTLTIFLAFALYCNCQSDSPGVSSSWAKLQISPDTLSSMEYGNFLIDIYEHANNHKATTTARDKKYFYSPLALLDSKSAASKYNKVTKRPEMRFCIEMWNDKIQNEVVKHLNKIVGQDLPSDMVRVIPLEKVILTSKTPTEGYSLSPVWTNYDKSRTIWFILSCYDQKDCDKLAEEMQSDPKQFHHLKLLYSLSSQTSQNKQTTISIDSVTSGHMASKLLQKYGDKKEVFLTANDEKKMLAETTANIRMDTFDDYEVVSPDTETHIYNILKGLLVTSGTTIKEQSDKMWDSVFWNEENYRPDKTTKTLNVIINKLDTETQKKLADMFEKAEKQSDIIENLTSSNKDVEKREENQLRRENQSKDANENEMKMSRATYQELFSRNQTHDEKSSTNIADTKIDSKGFGVSVGVKIANENNNTENSDQENEKRELAKNYLDEQKRSLENNERVQHNYDSNSWADVNRISSAISEKMVKDSDNSRRAEILKEDVEKLLKESRNHVEWDGEKFVPKPMQLSRINLGNFRDSQLFQKSNVRVRYTNAELSAPIKFVEHAELTVTDEWNNLKNELKATKELLKITVNNLVTTTTELSYVKSDLNKTRIDMTDKLEATKELLKETMVKLVTTNTELSSARSDLNNTKIEMTNKFKGTKQELERTRADLSKAADNLFKKLNVTDKELIEMRISDRNLSMELKANSQQLNNELKVAEEKLRKEIRETLNLLETTKINLNKTATELRSTNALVADLKTTLNSRTRDVVDIGKMPTSCEDLKQMGQKINGIFLVKGSKKMEMIYCNFYSNENKFQKWIGYADVKSAPVHFYVQRNSSFNKQLIPIPFELERTNEGNAMNLTSGKFTAPRSGIYFFSFSGVANFLPSFYRATLEVSLILNGNVTGTEKASVHHSVAEQSCPLTLHSTLNLKPGNKVWIHLTFKYGWPYLFDSIDHFTHFSGFMLEEEIVTSL